MTQTYASKNGGPRYRYYVCTKAQQWGRHTCPSKSLPAAEIEHFVVEQIRSLGKDPARLNEALAPATSHPEDGPQKEDPASAEAVALFQPEWETLPTADQVRTVRGLV